MDLARIKALIDMVAAAPIAELEVEEGPSRVRIAKRAPGAAPPAPPHAAAPFAATVAGSSAGPAPPVRAPVPPRPAATPPRPAPAAAPPAPPPPARPAMDAGGAVPSPMMGTFYRAPSPDAAPFVAVGDAVSAGQTLALIEAMKTLIKVEAERAGTLREVLAENGDPVEEGQTLFVIA